MANMSNGRGRTNAEADRNAETLLLASQKQRAKAVQEGGIGTVNDMKSMNRVLGLVLRPGL